MKSHLDTANLVTFLAGLKKNNHKAWFESHKSEFESLRSQFISIVGDVISESAKSFAPEIANVDPKKCMFRIYRDTRFAADKSPYKTNFGALIPIVKGKDVRVGYYLHIGADNRLMAGACTHPLPSASLTKARSYIAEHHSELQSILALARKSGLNDLDGEKQKTVPHGFSKDHPAAELLKHKSFKLLAIETATNANSDLSGHVVVLLRRCHPFAGFIRKALL
jgi:uncharacterized protein (TIGR02453 family)